MKTSRNGRAGFTLLEILIAIGILAIGLVTVFSLFPVGIYAVKETVDNTRGAALAGGARTELVAMRADMQILESGAQHYVAPSTPEGYVPFGPWRWPGSVGVFRGPLYEFVRLGGPVRRIVFDDRKYVPITLTTAPNGFNGTNTVTVRQADLDRDSDRLEYFYSPAAPGPNMYEPYEILLRVQGSVYRIVNRTYTAPLPNGDLATLVLAGAPEPVPPAMAGEVKFEVLLPVAVKEPAMDVPIKWLGGVADFSGAGPGYAVDARFENRNLAMHLCEQGADPGGWITTGGDWFQLTSVNRNAAGMPTGFQLAAPLPAPGGAGHEADEFQILLPVVAFDGSVNADGTETVRIVSPPSGATGGGGPQLGFLDTGAYIEVVLDGAWATFDLANATASTVVLDAATVNAATSPFLVAGNFIRVRGKDYEIATNLAANTFTIVGTVPQLGRQYFNIVLGYIPGGGQVSGIARFPVRGVQRAQMATNGYPGVTSFDVGPDANGNMPDDFFVAAGVAVPFTTPVQVLPRNFSQYSYEVVCSHKSLIGEFTAADPQVDAPSWPVSPEGPAIGPIPYPPSLDAGVANFNNSIYHMRLLTLPEPAGTYQRYDIADVGGGYSSLTVGGMPAFSATHLPFHVYDRNDFTADMLAGTGTYAAGPPDTVTFAAPGGSVTPDAIFLAPSVHVRLEDGVGMADAAVLSVDSQLNSIQVVINSGSVNPGAVTVTIVASGVGLSETPRCRGKFFQGSDIVLAVYPDQLSDLSTPNPTPPPPFSPLAGGANWRGFPFAAAPMRHNLSVGDYIEGKDAAGNPAWYAVKAIQDNLTEPADAWDRYDFLVLDRAYEGPTPALPNDNFFRYETPIQETYDAQVVVFRNYRIRALRDGNGSRAQAAAFGFDDTGARDPAGREFHVHLAMPLPPNYKPGDYIRADGDADHPSGTATDRGLGDSVDGDWRWYMIDVISQDRLLITLTSPYRGYVPATETWQPASVTNGIIRTFDTMLGAF